MPAKNLSAAIVSAAEGIRNKEIERKAASEFLQSISFESAAKILPGIALEGALFLQVPKENFSGKILGVDGGMLKEQYHGVDLILLRAVGVLFEYSAGKLAKHAYFPSENPVPEPTTIVNAESEMDFLLAANILRPKKEFETALAAAREFLPEILVMHGSIVPHPANRAGESSPLRREYLEMLEAYKALYSFCLEKGILLCGVVEDSRDNGFYQAVSANSPKAPKTNCRDSVILFDALATGERTCALKHSGHSQLENGLGRLARQVSSFYLKPAEFDRPVKVDFLSESSDSRTAEKVARAIYNTSRFNRSYGIPTVTIEADARAKLKEEDIELIFQQISDRAGATPLSLALRRKNRPF
ncbi:MAG: DNA double-strand break repair nuclease NurA [archaeon]